MCSRFSALSVSQIGLSTRGGRAFVHVRSSAMELMEQRGGYCAQATIRSQGSDTLANVHRTFVWKECKQAKLPMSIRVNDTSSN